MLEASGNGVRTSNLSDWLGVEVSYWDQGCKEHGMLATEVKVVHSVNEERN
jgi:hypothetical protein